MISIKTTETSYVFATSEVRLHSYVSYFESLEQPRFSSCDKV